VTDSSLIRYLNLIKNVRNWPDYFRHKSLRNFAPVRFTTRGAPITFEVPTLELYLVFKEIFLTDFYSVGKWAEHLPEHPIVVDVGANAGYFDLLLLSRRPDARIFAFEPVESNIALFQSTLAENPSIGVQPNLFHRAVTGSPIDEIVLYKESGNDNSVTASVFSDFEKHNLASVSVKAVSLAQILEQNKLKQIDFLKLDCEGSEYPILYESPRELWHSVHSIFMEVHDLDNLRRNFTSIRKFTESLGYSTTFQVAKNGCYAMHATRK